MSDDRAFINLSGALKTIRKSQNPLAPMTEALSNSLEAIASRNFLDGESPYIRISFYFSGLLDHSTFETMEIEDNGIGFNEDNYRRFKEFFDRSKGFNNRGSGRLQYLHRFDTITVDSVFGDTERKRRKFATSINSFSSGNTISGADDQDFRTTVSFTNLKNENGEADYYNNISIDYLFKELKRLLLLRFYLDSKKERTSLPTINIRFFKNGKLAASKSLTNEDMPTPIQHNKITITRSVIRASALPEIVWDKVANEAAEIEWAHFKLSENDLDANGVYLCSKNVPVRSVNQRIITKNQSYSGFRYMTAFYGSLLDDPENVNQEVDGFLFPERKEVENSKDDLFFDPTRTYLFFDDIQKAIDAVLPDIYKDVADIKREQQILVAEIADSHGIPAELVKEISITSSDTEETITSKLYTAQSKRLATKGLAVKRLFQSIQQLDPTSGDYQENLQKSIAELSSFIDDQDKEELSRYIIRREMVAETLKLILAEGLDAQVSSGKKRGDPEGFVHDLIFKRRKKTNDVTHDLWILNEEFVHFDGQSEVAISQMKLPNGEPFVNMPDKKTIKELGIKLDRRPDVFLFAGEGKCVLIEFKAPKIDLSDHLQQLNKYCTLIANYAAIPIQQFYCYLIGESINPIFDLGDYEETVNGDWLREGIQIRNAVNRDLIGKASIEVVKLSSIYERAKRRNKSFADKLGLHDLLQRALNSKPAE